jgi:hypothetical protein
VNVERQLSAMKLVSGPQEMLHVDKGDSPMLDPNLLQILSSRDSAGRHALELHRHAVPSSLRGETALIAIFH